MQNTNKIDSPILLVDANAPFFLFEDSLITNWSKIPFNSFQKNNHLDAKKVSQIESQFVNYLDKIKSFGYNSISLDDFVHLVPSGRYEVQINTLINEYRDWFKKLVSLAKERDMKVYVTADLFSFPVTQSWIANKSIDSIIDIFYLDIRKFFDDFSTIDGLILRMGESDGVDVAEDFRSKLKIKKPSDLNNLLKTILPLFEEHEKLLIFRTWAVGTYKIGDINWNTNTFEASFSGIESKNLIISSKPGGSDFFRYLSTTGMGGSSKYKFLVELQAKMEYEAAGSLPHYQGWKIFKTLSKMKNNPKFAGVSVWAQTGGWTKSKNLILVRDSSIWTELSLFTIIYVLLLGKEGLYWSVDRWLNKMQSKADPKKIFISLLLMEKSYVYGWYIREFAQRRLFVLRARLPTLLWIYWDEIMNNQLILSLMSGWIKHPGNVLKEGWLAYKTNKQAAKQLTQLEPSFAADMKSMNDTFLLLFLIRYWWLNSNIGIVRLVAKYNQYYLESHQFGLRVSKIYLFKKNYLIENLSKVIVRQKSEYRIIEDILLSWPSRKLIQMVIRISGVSSKVFSTQKAMSVVELLD